MNTNILQQRSRKWLITINNPAGNGVASDPRALYELVEHNLSTTYFCMSYEKGLKEQTEHAHIFLYFKNPHRGDKIAAVFFKKAHLDVCRGSCAENRDYVFKAGKWTDTEKEETRVDGTQYESGELPEEKGQGKRTDLDTLLDMIKNGATNTQILNKNSDYLRYISSIDRIRQEYEQDKWRDTFRHLEVTYVCGKTGKGKTREIMEKYGYRNVKRVTNYEHPFDDYRGEDVVIFEEFRSNLAIEQMLNYLDGYPVCLPSRYSDKWAGFTKVFICTNWDLMKQYKNIQENHQETWNAFLRRIHKVKVYSTNDSAEYTTTEYLYKLAQDNTPDWKEKFEEWKINEDPFNIWTEGYEEELYIRFMNELVDKLYNNTSA